MTTRTIRSSAPGRAPTRSTGTSTGRSSTRFATRTTSTSRPWPSWGRSGSCSSSWRSACRSSPPSLARGSPLHPGRARGLRGVPRPRGCRLGLGDGRGHAVGSRDSGGSHGGCGPARLGPAPFAEGSCRRRRRRAPAVGRRLRRRRRVERSRSERPRPGEGRVRRGSLPGAQGQPLVALVTRALAPPRRRRRGAGDTPQPRTTTGRRSPRTAATGGSGTTSRR